MDTDEPGRRTTSCEDEGRDQDAVSASQGTPKIARKPPEDKGEARSRFLLTVLRRKQPS